jgi:CDP-paratose 2-epimerase
MPSILITGGAGFIGMNTASHFARKGWKVIALDDLSRRGANENLGLAEGKCADCLRRGRCPGRSVSGERAGAPPVRRRRSPRRPSRGDHVSRKFARRFRDQHPRHAQPAGGIEERETRYEFRDIPQGVSEERRLDFHSPYGCSKGAADQYTLDCHKSYGLKTVTFRQSCIYGPHQFGVEDQGWVAWFIIAALLGRPLTIYGDGKQVRDVLHVDDLARLYEMAAMNADKVNGKAYNIGGGPENAISLLELLALLEKRLGRPVPRAKADWRRGDQPVYVSDLSRVSTDLGWRPSIP